jgi:hypothetical protein
MPQVWMDNTGLYQKYGTDQTVTQTGGEYRNDGALREIEFKITLASLTTTTSTVVPGMDNVFMPAGMFIEEIQVINDVAATSGGSATLNIGLVRTDRSTEIDYDGLVAALALASVDATGERVTLTKGSTGAGALVGATTANVGHFVAYYGTAAFTAGQVTVRVRYRKV